MELIIYKTMGVPWEWFVHLDMLTFLWEILKWNYTYPYIKDKTLLYLCYTDYLFFICKVSKEELLTIFDTINKAYPSTKFYFRYSHETIEFLDTKIYKNKDGKSRSLKTSAKLTHLQSSNLDTLMNNWILRHQDI